MKVSFDRESKSLPRLIHVLGVFRFLLYNMSMKTNDIVKRNISLTGEIMRYLLDNPQVFESLPDDFELVILPENNPEMGVHNLSLLDKFGNNGKEIVFARVGASKPNLFARAVA